MGPAIPARARGSQLPRVAPSTTRVTCADPYPALRPHEARAHPRLSHRLALLSARGTCLVTSMSEEIAELPRGEAAAGGGLVGACAECRSEAACARTLLEYRGPSRCKQNQTKTFTATAVGIPRPVATTRMLRIAEHASLFFLCSNFLETSQQKQRGPAARRTPSCCVASHRPRARDAPAMPSSLPYCNGSLAYSEKTIGLNNQMISLATMVCLAHVMRVRLGCIVRLHEPWLGYIPGGNHLPGNAYHYRQVTTNHPKWAAAMPLRSLLNLNAGDAEIIQYPDADSPVAETVPCRRGESATDCSMCTPYMHDPLRCAEVNLRTSKKVWMDYPFGMNGRVVWSVDSATGLRTKRPALPCVKNFSYSLSTAVETYAATLMERLQLTPGQFVAAQWRTGMEWRKEVQRLGKPWACYGMSTVNATLKTLLASTGGGEALRMPRFLLTNQRTLHAPGTPVPIGILAELRVASLAHFVLLNPVSTFQSTLSVLRAGASRSICGGKTRGCSLNAGVRFVQPGQVLKDDRCEACSSVDAEPLTPASRAMCNGSDSMWNKWGHAHLANMRRSYLQRQPSPKLAAAAAQQSRSATLLP